MPSRINIGPENGPYIAINENNGDIELQDNTGAVVAKWDDGQSQWDFVENDISGVGAFDSESVNTGILHITNGPASYTLNNAIDVPNDTATDIDEWAEDTDPIGSMSEGKDWSPNEDGVYLIIANLTAESLSGSDAEVRPTVSDHSIGPDFRFGAWNSMGNIAANDFAFWVSLNESDSVALDVRHRSGEQETLRQTTTQMQITKVA